MHEDYTATDLWRALFLAALQGAGRERVDVLVTRLPAQQHRDPALRARLEGLVGVHHPSPGRAVRIGRVVVLPQPAGAYLDLLAAPQTALLDVFETGRTLVIDPGYYSVDWLVIEAGVVRKSASGSSLKSVQTILRATPGGGPDRGTARDRASCGSAPHPGVRPAGRPAFVS